MSWIAVASSDPKWISGDEYVMVDILGVEQSPVARACASGCSRLQSDSSVSDICYDMAPPCTRNQSTRDSGNASSTAPPTTTAPAKTATSPSTASSTATTSAADDNGRVFNPAVAHQDRGGV